MNDTWPNIFIVAGMPRSGTTFLYHNFQKHPHIYTPPIKETNFFSSNNKRGKGWFNKLYKGMAESQIGCDISPLYFLDPLSVERISHLDKDIKVILSIRDPVEFAVSLYNNCSTFIWKMPPFEKFIKSFHLKKGLDYTHFSLTSNSTLFILQNFQRAFGDRLLFYSYTFFKANPLKVLRMIEHFIGVPAFFTEENYDRAIINATKERNIKILSYMSNNQTLLSLMNRLLPPPLFGLIRRTFYNLDLKRADPMKITQGEELYKISEEAFSGDREAIRDLFGKYDVMLGSGKPFNMTSQNSEPEETLS